MPDRKIWKQKKKIPTHGVQQILKGAINSENCWLGQRAYSCPFRRLDIVQENHEVYHQYFHSSHFKAQCSSVWIYSRCCHPYLRPRHSLWSECSLDFNLSFLPVSIVKTRHVPIELQRAAAHQSAVARGSTRATTPHIWMWQSHFPSSVPSHSGAWSTAHGVIMEMECFFWELKGQRHWPQQVYLPGYRTDFDNCKTRLRIWAEVTRKPKTTVNNRIVFCS